MNWVIVGLCGLMMALPGCGDDSPQLNSNSSKPANSTALPLPATSIRFEEVTASSGVDFTYRNGDEAGEAAILESLGGGIALFDFDGDGDLDLCCPGGGHYSDKKSNGQRDALGWGTKQYRARLRARKLTTRIFESLSQSSD